MELDDPLRVRTATDARTMDQETRVEDHAKQFREALGRGLHACMARGPRTPRKPGELHAQSAGVDERIGLDVDLESRRRSARTDDRRARPRRQVAFEASKGGLVSIAQLGNDVQKRA
jgi:hypothetical protein